MKMILAMSWMILLMGFSHCSRQPANPQSAMLGRYELVGHDNAGQLIFTGAISLTSLEQAELKGQCKVVKATEAFEGAVDKDGPCEGLVEGNSVTLDLAPSLADGGLIFEGQFDNGRITGIWMFETFAGRKPLGKFEAVKKS
jgi:hypothetical protein